MKNLPIAFKAMINILLYILYVLFVSLIFSFVFPLVMQGLGKEVLNPALPENRALFDKIQIFIAIFVLLLSLILRKYFYVSCKNEESEKKVVIKESYTAKKKQEKAEAPKTQKVEKEQKVEQKPKNKDEEDEEIKIYVEKEIK